MGASSNVSALRRDWTEAVQPALTVDPENLSDLVGAIYDAAVSPGRWPEVLGDCRNFVGGCSASIFCKDTTGVAGGIFYQDGNISPHYGQLYFETYARLDPTTGAHVMAALEQPIATADVLQASEFLDTRFYREWVEPQGLVDFVSAPIEKSGNWAAMFGVFRHERDGVVDPGAKTRMSLLVPHIRRAVLIGKVIEQRSFEAASLGDAFDGLAAGMFLVDADGRLVHANAPGRQMLNRNGAIDLRNGRITAHTEAANDALAAALTATTGGDSAVGVRGISIAMEDARGEHYAAHVLPLTSGARRRTGVHYSAVAALFVHRATLDAPAAPETIARTFELTLTELRVMMAIVQVGGVPETADALGIAETTVKTHLHRVFSKTGTARQADLVRLVAGFAGPLSR